MMNTDDMNKSKKTDIHILDGTTAFQRIDPGSDSSPDNGLACSQQEKTSTSKAIAHSLFPVANSAAAIEGQKSKATSDSNANKDSPAKAQTASANLVPASANLVPASANLVPASGPAAVNNLAVSLCMRDEQDRYLKKFGFQRHRIQGDGNCLFRAVSYAIYGTESHHGNLRRQSSTYILENPAFFKSPDYFDNYDTEALQLFQDGKYGEVASKVALAVILHRQILETLGGENENFKVITKKYGNARDGISPIHIVCSGAHYDTAVRIKPAEIAVKQSQVIVGNEFNLMKMDDDMNKRKNRSNEIHILDGTTESQLLRTDPGSDSSSDNGLACSQQEKTSTSKAIADSLFPVANSAAAIEGQKSKATPDSNAYTYPALKLFKHVNIGIITEDVVEEKTIVAGKKYTTLRYPKEKNREIYQLFLQNNNYLRGNLISITTWKEFKETVEMELIQAKKEGVSRIVWTLIDHGQRAWKFLGRRVFDEPTGWLSCLYSIFCYIPFADINVETLDVIKYLRKKAYEYEIQDTHVLMCLCWTFLVGTDLNEHNEGFRFTVHHSTSKAFPIASFEVEFNRKESDTDPGELVVNELDEKVDFTGMQILMNSIKQYLPDEHPFESNSHLLVPSQRNTGTGEMSPNIESLSDKCNDFSKQDDDKEPVTGPDNQHGSSVGEPVQDSGISGSVTSGPQSESGENERPQIKMNSDHNASALGEGEYFGQHLKDYQD